MASSDLFLAKYREWFEIVLFEHRTIREQKWDDLPRYQQRKEELLKDLQTLEKSHPNWKKEQSDSLKLLIHQLADMEQLNHSLAEEKRKDLKIKVDDINRRSQAGRKLRNLYGEKKSRVGGKVSGRG